MDTEDVLSMGSFPSTSVLTHRFIKGVPGAEIQRFRGRNCICGAAKHRSLFDLLQTKISTCVDKKLPVWGVKICWNADNIWECKLPKYLTGLSRRTEFENMPSIWHAQKVLFSGTYWFKRLLLPDKVGQTHGRNGVALLRLLAGKKTYAGPERVYQLAKLPINKGRVNSLRQILATVDGLLMQLILSFPRSKEILNWSFIDRVTNSLICQLLPDYFRDLRDDVSRLTTFEKVKTVRGQIKEMGFNPIGSHRDIDIPQEISFFRTITRILDSEGKTPLNIFRVATLCQTRAAGVPPRVVYQKTMDKIIKILREPSDKTRYLEVCKYLPRAIDRVYYRIIDSIDSRHDKDAFFATCSKAAKISLSDSGEFFSKAENGGKLEAARKVLSVTERLQVIDLNSGELKPEYLVRSDSNQGEMLFLWACHQFLDRRNIYDRNVMSVRISLVAELGKYRAITVSHLAHAVLLHVLSHVLLEFLKIIPSSASGVGAANHAWEFFKRLSHKNPSANFLFSGKENYLFSTDWEQATDYCDHYIAQAILNRFCDLLGIPVWYRQTCSFALCAPRQVEFINKDNKVLDMFLTQRGELMGDPVVKFILHCYHLVARESAVMLIEKVRAGPP